MGSDPAGVRVAIALGSNLGDRRAHLDHAVRALARELLNLQSSTFIETEPAGVGPGQPGYLNAAVTGTTTATPRGLLDRLLQIEQERGRDRPYAMAPRTLDLDLVLYGAQILNEEGLSIPHPRFRERQFVLAPLAEIAPDMQDPVSGHTITQLLAHLLKP